MNDRDSIQETDGVEVVRAHEIVKDEDILSYGARVSLEQVGSAVGFVCAIALLFAMLPRAARLFGARVSAASGAASGMPSEPCPEPRETRDLERRALAEVADAETERIDGPRGQARSAQ